jgi:hypothetical protein
MNPGVWVALALGVVSFGGMFVYHWGWLRGFKDAEDIWRRYP